jgi:PAS domain S-box-containing protein
MYTHIDGPHARVPVGQFKIGRIAQNCMPHLTNSVATDPEVGDPVWAAREGMVAFAGHPLVVSGRVTGVLALFARHPLSDCLLDALKVVADTLALGIVRKQAENALRESEQRFRQLFEANPHPMWVFDSETTEFLAVNDAAIHHYGYSRAQFLAMNIQRIEAVPLVSGLGRAARIRQHRLASGQARQVEVAANPIEFGGRPGTLVLAFDVTDRKLLEDQLKQAQKPDSIGQLASGIAHEINTPIQYIGDNTTFLGDTFRDLAELLTLYRSAGDDPILRDKANQAADAADVDYLLEEAPRAIGQTLDGVKHVAGIVKAMKEFAHPGTNEKAPVDLNHSIQTVITVARNEWKYVAEIETEFAPDLPPVPALPGELNQVFLNLLVNAAHAVKSANGSDGPKGTIRFITRRSGNAVEVRISDSGCGIPPEIQERIFDPFFTTKPVGQGTGQGLTIAHTAVTKHHGGSLSFESEVGKGTTFIVRLPVSGSVLTDSERIRLPDRALVQQLATGTGSVS